MTTPSTAAVRAWARSNGYDVADRGRLPAELTDAYLAAQGKEGTGTKRPAKKAPGRTAAKAPAKAASGKPRSRSTKVTPAPAAETAATKADAPAATEPVRPEPKPKPVSDDRRLVALGEQLAALTQRVEALEKAVGSKPNGKSGGKRFLRSR